MKDRILDIDNEMRWPFGEQQFFCGSVVDYYQKQIEEWEKADFPNSRELSVGASIHCMVNNAIVFGFYNYARIMLLLFYLISDKAEDDSAIIYNMKISYKLMDNEYAREFAASALKQVSKSDLKNSGKEYIKLLEEGKNENVADILGMILDELESKIDLSEEDYDLLLTELSKPIEKWRYFDLPKASQEESHETIRQIIEICYKWKAYESLLRLSGLLFITSKNSKNFYDDLFLMGKVAFDLGYIEVAKQCFTYVEQKIGDNCWDSTNRKYRDVLNKETHLEIPQDAYELEKEIKIKLEKGEIRLYTRQEVWDYLDKKIEIPFIDQAKLMKQRIKTGEKAVKKYQKYNNEIPEKQLKGLEEAFLLLSDDKYQYESAGYLFYTKGKIFENMNEHEKAYECFLEAYKCFCAKSNPILLLSIANQLFIRKRNAKGIAYVFRAYILTNKQSIVELMENACDYMEKKYLV